ncbi:MAG: hypothetical protein JJU06_16820 [Ectothiorhodospiraceae bacterium]|nr:hypothetical protein [Ectothiorhodospiraceae bacterium]MCH8506615.1 hypothetical protein [Ectothiorhodospiraceae bacterium]
MPRKKPYLYLVVLILLVTPLFFFDTSGLERHVPNELYAFAHVGVFALLALALLHIPVLARRHFALQATVALAAIFLVGGAIELIQPHFGRQASWRDLWQNMVGAAAAIAIMAPNRRLLLALLPAATLLVVLELYGPAATLWDRHVARQQFPMLSDFETRHEHRRWSSGTVTTEMARAGSRSLRLDLQPGRYSGTMMRRSFGDWSEFTHFRFSIYNPDIQPLILTVSIRDHAHFQRGGLYNDRFNQRYTLERGWNDISIPIETIRAAPRERQLDVSDLAEVVLFTSNLTRPRVIYLDQVMLD